MYFLTLIIGLIWHAVFICFFWEFIVKKVVRKKSYYICALCTVGMLFLTLLIPDFISESQTYINYCEIGKGDVVDDCISQLKQDAVLKIIQWSEIAVLGIILFSKRNQIKHYS